MWVPRIVCLKKLRVRRFCSAHGRGGLGGGLRPPFTRFWFTPSPRARRIVDAERHRRTPRPWAISGKTIYIRMMGLIQIDSMRNTGRKLATLAIKIKQQVGPSRRGRKQFSHNRLRNRRSYSQLNKNTDLLTRTFRPSRHVPSLTTSFPGASARWKLSVRTASGDEQGE